MPEYTPSYESFHLQESKPKFAFLDWQSDSPLLDGVLCGSSKKKEIGDLASQPDQTFNPIIPDDVVVVKDCSTIAFNLLYPTDDDTYDDDEDYEDDDDFSSNSLVFEASESFETTFVDDCAKRVSDARRRMMTQHEPEISSSIPSQVIANDCSRIAFELFSPFAEEETLCTYDDDYFDNESINSILESCPRKLSEKANVMNIDESRDYNSAEMMLNHSGTDCNSCREAVDSNDDQIDGYIENQDKISKEVQQQRQNVTTILLQYHHHRKMESHEDSSGAKPTEQRPPLKETTPSQTQAMHNELKTYFKSIQNEKTENIFPLLHEKLHAGEKNGMEQWSVSSEQQQPNQ